jgi:predicted acyl esterase
MIDFIIAFFYFADDLGLVKIEQIFTTNLITLLLIRGFYIIVYLLTYNKKTERAESFIFSKKEMFYFGIKQVSLILFGILFFPLTIFISVYTLMISGTYLKQWRFKAKERIFKTLGFLITLLTPLLSILWFLFINIDYYSMAAIGISLLIFLQYGLKTAKYSLKELFDKYTKRRLQKLPHIFQYILLFILIAFPTSLLLMTAVYSPPDVITYMVPMRDDVKLATDVYFAPGSFGTARPVILVRTPYGKSGMGELFGMLYSTQNYHLVVQDIRGTFGSPTGDKYLLFIDAYKDGVDTIEWLLEQPWCNGKIASAGASALGINEYYYAGMNPSGLVAQSLMIATPDLYKTSIYQGGEFKESIATQWVMMTSPDNYEYQLDQLITHPMKDIFYNSTSLFMDIGPTFKNVSVAGIHIGGWYDPFQQGTLDGYRGYDDSGLLSARGKQLLIMGPFTHGFPGEGKRGELVFPTKSVSGYELYLDWEQKLFDYALLSTPFDWDGNRVAYYVMGDINDVSANDYRYAKDWPIPYTNDTWYLTANNGLNLTGSGIQSYNFTYQFDPRDPVPTLGGTNLVIASGPYDQSSLESRNDVLIFDSPIFTSPYEVIGNMWAHLYVKSNCTNTDFTVKISDVYPDGRSMLISDGIINAMRRDGFNKTAKSLIDEDYAEVDIDLWSTAYRFDTGHKMRIAISSSNYPRFGVNPNTGESPRAYSYQYLQRYIANNSILVGPDYPSYIVLPILI